MEHLDPQEQRRKNIPFIQMVLVFLMKVVGSIKTIDEISDHIQTYMTMGMKALITAFLKWQEEQLQLEALGKQSTWQMYRRKLKVLNRNKLTVFMGQHFGIFPSHEVFMLANVPVHDIAKDLNITREQVYARYTKRPLAENS